MDFTDRIPSNPVPTSTISFVETEHGRLRQKQRGIDKKDLQSAIKYGERTISHIRRPNGDEVGIYTYKDIVYIVNERTKEEVTCYAKPIELEPVPVSKAMSNEHDRALDNIINNLGSWTSNTVMVVDTSGSMKAADIWGARNRLSSVWISIALDFLAHRLETGAAGPTDVISIVTLGPTSEVVLREQPCTWILYNQIVDIYSNKKVSPFSHGNFLPSLNTAELLLTRNPNAACAMCLSFLSDGKPSDQELGSTAEDIQHKIIEKVESLAKKFGRRFTFSAIGIGDDQNFEMLEKMVEGANDYGAHGIFQLPSMTSSSVGAAFTSVASSVTSTQTEITDVDTMKQQKVRDVIRESRKKASQHIRVVSSDDFYIYPRNKVVRTVYKEEWSHVSGRKERKFLQTDLQHPDAKYVAFAKGPFGEGGERFAYRFYELGADRKTILGPPLVAKESRLVLDGGFGEISRQKFVHKFCATQQLAGRLAEEFNKKMDKLDCIDKSTPRIKFLDCSVYQLDDINLGVQSVLVEEKVNHNKWKKWNSNNGFVEGMKSAPIFTDETMRKAFTGLATEDMGIIEEESEEDSEEDDGDLSNTLQSRIIQPKIFTPSEVAQAFSHFSYWASGQKRLVCDLQGEFVEKDNVLVFSDPVIHYHSASNRRNVHGKTDRGVKGVAMFFETHRPHCGHLCKLMIKGFKTRHCHRSGNNRNNSQHNA